MIALNEERLIQKAVQETFEKFSKSHDNEKMLKKILNHLEKQIDKKIHHEISEIAKELRKENKKNGETKFFHNLKGRIIALHKLIG